MRTIDQFIANHALAMIAKQVSTSPTMENMPDGSSHWYCKIEGAGGAEIRTYFSMGPGLNGREPECAEVLSCLASDSVTFDQALDFEEWATDLGFDPDSRKAGRIYEACEEQAIDLERELGEEAYKDLLYNVEPY